MTSLLQKARESGKCPPSLIKEENASDEDAFEAEALAVVGATGGTFFARVDDSFVSSLVGVSRSHLPLVSPFVIFRTVTLQRLEYGRFV
jgi:hypothetical protein